MREGGVRDGDGGVGGRLEDKLGVWDTGVPDRGLGPGWGLGLRSAQLSLAGASGRNCNTRIEATGQRAWSGLAELRTAVRKDQNRLTVRGVQFLYMKRCAWPAVWSWGDARFFGLAVWLSLG